jgi:hypothetical protein
MPPPFYVEQLCRFMENVRMPVLSRRQMVGVGFDGPKWRGRGSSRQETRQSSIAGRGENANPCRWRNRCDCSGNNIRAKFLFGPRLLNPVGATPRSTKIGIASPGAVSLHELRLQFKLCRQRLRQCIFSLLTIFSHKTKFSQIDK